MLYRAQKWFETNLIRCMDFKSFKKSPLEIDIDKGIITARRFACAAHLSTINQSERHITNIFVELNLFQLRNIFQL